MIPLMNVRRDRADFATREDGGATVLSLTLLISLVALGGIAVDVSNVTSSRTELQMTADAVAHAALLSRDTKNASSAKADALSVSVANLPAAEVGQVIRAEDIVFGKWIETTQTFIPEATSRSAVQVTARQNSDGGNPIATFMLKVVGFDEWDVTVRSTFSTYRPSCLREGFVAEGVVDLQSNNSYTNGFCIHSNEYVSLNSNNTFEPGTVVSMTDTADLDLPNSGYDTNAGLSEALREGSWNIRILSRINTIIAGIQDPQSIYYPKYLTSATPLTLANRTVEQADLVPGRIHKASCRGGAALTIGNNVAVDKVVIVSSCPIKFNQGVVVTDSVIATTDISDKSITSAAGLQVGRDDNCATGGEAQIVTLGSMSFPSDLKIFGSQLLALKDIVFSANASGVEGAQMVAGGKISGTSNMTMGFCGNMASSNFQAEYFKLVN